MSLSSGERDSYFFLCESASFSKNFPFFSGGRDSPPLPSEHLRLFWWEKKSSFFSATTEQNIAHVNLFHKPSVSFYLMAIVAIVAIHWECITPVALFNWSVVTY
jgi:hypothetical protein